MRFDLEITKVSTCRDLDLKNLSSWLYDSLDETILPAIYDRKTSFDKDVANRGSVNTKKYLNFKEVPKYLFDSYITDSNLKLHSIKNNKSSLYPVFYGGEVSLSNSAFNWSSLYIKAKCNYDANIKRLCLDIQDDFLVESVSAYTLSLQYPGLITKEKDFKYLPYRTSLDNTFLSSTEDFTFTIRDSKVILNVSSVEVANIVIGRGDGTTRIFPLPEFPIGDIEVYGYTSDQYEVSNGLLIFKSDSIPIIREDIKIGYTVDPIVSYKKTTDARDDIVYVKSAISPNNLGFSNGMLCLYNSYDNLEYPSNLTLSSESINSDSNIYRVTATLTNSIGMPVKNKEVTLNILEEGALFANNTSTSIKCKTSMTGEVSTIVYGDFSKLGYFIQREWVSGDTITIPKDLDIDNINNAFLYFVMNDDPILGKTYASSTDKSIEEYYKKSDLLSYYVSGRKVAYIELFNKDNKLLQKYRKPTSVTKHTNQSIVFRNLKVGSVSSNNLIVSSQSLKPFSLSYTTVPPSGMYKSGTLPSNKLQFYQKTIPTTTKLTFADQIPKTDAINGYLLILNSNVDIQAVYSDDDSKIESDILSLTIKNIKSELPFMISGISMHDRSTALNDLSYLTVSDYIVSDYNLMPNTYGCIHSDVINKSCIHKNKLYRQYYGADSSNLMCIHTPSYESSIDDDKKCPGMNAQILNPFILFADTGV